jgi:hypothetical protein
VCSPDLFLLLLRGFQYFSFQRFSLRMVSPQSAWPQKCTEGQKHGLGRAFKAGIDFTRQVKRVRRQNLARNF